MRLRYTTDAKSGFTRKKTWGSFKYFDEKGKRIRDKATLERIRKLGIPPAYTDVWICPFENGHIQATARDSRGRKQYIYHTDWVAQRDETKYDHLLTFADALSSIRRRIRRDLDLPGMPKEKVIATIVKLLDTAYVRIGNEEYAKENDSYGLTTLRNRHLKGTGDNMRLVFKGKHAVAHEVPIEDKRLRKIIAECQDLPGHELFEYLDDNDESHPVDSEDVNDYLKEIADNDITAKDFRTWHGTVLAATYLWSCPECETKKDRQMHIKEAIKEASDALNNTVAVCKKSYIHPRILERYKKGKLELPEPTPSFKKKYPNLLADELRVVCLLEKM